MSDGGPRLVWSRPTYRQRMDACARAYELRRMLRIRGCFTEEQEVEARAEIERLKKVQAGKARL